MEPILIVSLFDGIGARRVAGDALRVPVAGYILVEISEDARRVVESWFPEVKHITDVALIDEHEVSSWSLLYPSVCAVVLGAGPPCQGVSGLNSDRKGALKDARSCLFTHVPRVEQLLRRFFRWCPVYRIAENVASMDARNCNAMNEAYEGAPWLVDAGGVSLARRPRLYWFIWESLVIEGARKVEDERHRLPLAGRLHLEVAVDEKDYLEPGWRRCVPHQVLPTFTTSRPSSIPGRKPAGIELCSAVELDRWREDQHRFPPYQYKTVNCLTNGTQVRTPNTRERECILGFPLNYTAKCYPKGQQHSPAWNDCRLTLLGNTWSIPVICYLLHSLFCMLGLNTPLIMREIVRRLILGEEDSLPSLLLRPPLRRTTQQGGPNAGLVRRLLGQVSVKGEDLLLQMGSDIPARYHRLRASIPGKLWRWKEAAGWQWTGSPEHINVLELRAVKTALAWRIRELKEQRTRFLHLVDSLVVLHALSRGRSSSRKLRRTLAKIAAMLVASGLQGTWGYIDTHQNPADKPSRRPLHRRWVRKRQK